jgi:hypothetical protein
MTTRRGLVGGASLLVLGATACGAFLGSSGDDESPKPPEAAEDAGTTDDGGSTFEGGSSVDASRPVDAASDAARKIGATCGQTKCDPGVPCCVSSAGGACVTGEMVCTGSELTCARDLDCPQDEVCCITVARLGTSRAQCTKSACADGSGHMCSVQDSPADQGCGAQTCVAGGKSTSSFGLPASDDWAVCE